MTEHVHNRPVYKRPILYRPWIYEPVYLEFIAALCNSAVHYNNRVGVIHLCRGRAKGVPGGPLPPQNFCFTPVAPPKFSTWRHVTALKSYTDHWQLPCCKTGPSSGPPKRKCLAPPLHVCMLFNNNTRLCLFNVTMLTRFACIVFCYQSISLHSCIWVPLIVIVMYA